MLYDLANEHPPTVLMAGNSILWAYLMGTGTAAARHGQVCVVITRFQMALLKLKKASWTVEYDIPGIQSGICSL